MQPPTATPCPCCVDRKKRRIVVKKPAGAEQDSQASAVVMCGECESFDAKRSEHLCPKDIPLVPLQVEEAFSGLSPSERLYAHHFSQACWAGIPIVAAQTSPESPLLLELIARMFSGGTAALRANLSPEFPAEHWGDLLDFCAFCVGNLGNFKAIGDSKVVPRLPLDSFAAAVSATGNDRALELWSQVQAAVYSPEGAIADGYYTGGASAAEDGKLVGLALEERREEAWNTRVEKRASDGTLIIRSASVREQEEEPFEFRGVRMARATGDHSAALANVVTHLRRALPHAPSAHASAMLRALTEHFTDGAIDLHKQASAEWVKDDPAVETTIGFIETDRDPQGVRAEFEGFVAVRNAVMSAKFARLVAFAPTLLSRLPWGAEFERDTFQAPAFTSLDVLSFCSGSLPLGICLPNYDEVRSTAGFKNVDLGNVCTARSDGAYSLFLSSDDAALFRGMYAQADQCLTGLHELIGHGSGKLLQAADLGTVRSPITGAPVATHYNPGQTYGSVFGPLASAMEECRAECVSLYLSPASDVQAIFGFEGQASRDSIYAGWLGMCWLGLKALEHYDPDAKAWGAVHGRARFAILRLLLEASDAATGASAVGAAAQTTKDGATRAKDGPPSLLRLVWSEDADGPDVRLAMDRELIESVGQPAIGQLLLEIHIARCTADPALAARFERLSSVPDELLPLWRVVKQRKRERDVFVQSNTRLVGGDEDDAALVSYEVTREGLLQSFVDRWGAICA